MSAVRILIKRNIKLFFKDKGLFFTSLITPMILMVLYATFLGKVYRDSILLSIPTGFSVTDDLISGAVGGQLLSSLLAVCCITVAFCSNMLMVQDKMTGAKQDMMIAPQNPSVLAFSYYIATLCSTLIVCFIATGATMIYLGFVGFYMTFLDVILIFSDVLLLVMFGTALSSLINFFLSTQGQISAVGTIVSSGYGFICGAYMPLSQFPDGLRKIVSFLPGTYGTSLIRNHAMRGALSKMESEGLPAEIVDGMRDAMDCNLYFFGEKVDEWIKLVVLLGSIGFILGAYIILNCVSGHKKPRK